MLTSSITQKPELVCRDSLSWEPGKIHNKVKRKTSKVEIDSGADLDLDLDDSIGLHDGQGFGVDDLSWFDGHTEQSFDPFEFVNVDSAIENKQTANEGTQDCFEENEMDKDGLLDFADAISNSSGQQDNPPGIQKKSVKRKRSRLRGSESKKKSKNGVSCTNFNKKIFTSLQAQTAFSSKIKLWCSKTMQFKYKKVPKCELKKSVAHGGNGCYTLNDVSRFKLQYKKKMQMDFIKKFAKTNEVKYDDSKTRDKNLERVQCIYEEKDIEILGGNENGRWSDGFSFAFMQAFVTFRTWPNRNQAIRKYMGNTKTLTTIKDHLFEVKRARMGKNMKEHPYVLYDKINEKKNNK